MRYGGGVEVRPSRPQITVAVNSLKLLHNGTPCRVVMSRNKISVGCTDVTPDALRWLLEKYEALFGSGDGCIEVQGE